MSEQGQDWNERPITLARSKRGVVVVCDFADNLIRDERLPWPPPPVVQKLYESRQSRAFAPAELKAVTARLGFYSDLQSLNSEDAITWGYFGPFLAGTPRARAKFADWLLDRVGLAAFAGSKRCQLDLWRRIPHPDRPTSSGGPELDVVLDTHRAVVFGEAKWRSKEAANQGVDKTKSQLQLRRDFLGVIGPRIYGDRGYMVLGIVLDEPLGAAVPPDKHGVHTASIRWDELAEYKEHPKRQEFVRYLAWKRSFLPQSHQRKRTISGHGRTPVELEPWCEVLTRWAESRSDPAPRDHSEASKRSRFHGPSRRGGSRLVSLS